MKATIDNQVTFEISLASNLLPGASAETMSGLPEPEDSISADFDRELSKADRADCLIAAASGTLAAAIDILWVGEFSLTRAQKWGHEKAGDLVVQAARLTGYEGDDLKKAIEHLEKVFPLAADKLTAEFGGGLQHHLRDFAHHPTPVGLLFSILSQFTGKGYGTDTTGAFVVFDLPEGAPIGANFTEKVLNGTVRWAFHLISDLDGSSSNPGAGTGIPGPLLSLFKEASSLPLFRDLALRYKGDDIGLSQFLSKLFNGTAFPHEGYKDLLRFDLRTEMGVAHELARQTVPVVLNECVVRAAYSIRRLVLAAKAHEVKGLADLAKIDPKLYLPANSRALTRMLTVAHGTFMAIDAAQAAVRAAAEARHGKAAVAVRFLLNVNFVGVGRFAVACKADAKYIADDISELYRSYFAEHCGQVIDLAGLKGLDRLTLDPPKARMLNSLKYHKALWDASATKDEAKRARKVGWCVRWAGQASEAFADGDDAYVIDDEDEAYDMLGSEISASADTGWLRVLALELSVFEPYTRLEEGEGDEKGLKCARGYEEKVFCERQDELSRGQACMRPSRARRQSARDSSRQWDSSPKSRRASWVVLSPCCSPAMTSSWLRAVASSPSSSSLAAAVTRRLGMEPASASAHPRAERASSPRSARRAISSASSARLTMHMTSTRTVPADSARCRRFNASASDLLPSFSYAPSRSR